MTTLKSEFAVATVILAAAVADDGTFTVGYPTGTSQLSFTAGGAGTGHVAYVNGNDKWLNADPGFGYSFGASDITVTNRTGAALAAGSRIDMTFAMVAGNARIPITIPLPPLATITAADVITEIRPGIEGKLEYAEFVTTIAVTTASKLATLNFEIDTTDCTGGVIALTSAALTPKGKAVGSTAFTGNNTLTKESKLSIEASAVTAFVEGEGFIIAYVRPTPEVEA